MSSDEKNTAKRARDEGPRRALPIGALALALVAPGVLAWTWSRPLSATPREMPPLVLDPSAVAACLAHAREEASHEPRGELADERRRLFHEVGVAEVRADETPEGADARHVRLVAILGGLVRAHGESAVARIRAADLERFEPALRGALPAGDRLAELGSFPGVLERYGAVEGRRQIAPTPVLRAFFAARWNAIHERPLTEGLCPVERLAYHGWLGLGASDAPLDQRLEALDAYAAAGGRFADEARGTLLLEAGDREGAREAFERAHQAEPIFRLRNFAIGTGAAEPSEDSEED